MRGDASRRGSESWSWLAAIVSIPEGCKVKKSGIIKLTDDIMAALSLAYIDPLAALRSCATLLDTRSPLLSLSLNPSCAISMAHHLFLAGYRGTGKSAVAEVLSERLRMQAVDLDADIQRSAGRSIAEIFASGGEGEFRRLESERLDEIAKGPARLVALGGGAVLREENRRVIRQAGRCALLTASVETIAARIAGDSASAAQRPALTTLGQLEEIRQLLESRNHAYRAVADFVVDTDRKSVTQVAGEIAQWWAALADDYFPTASAEGA